MIRPLRADELRGALDLFAATIHRGPIGDEHWDADAQLDWHDRTFGSFDGPADGGELAGVTWSFPSRTAVPGGATLPTAAVSRVGVRADRTRRGHLTSLMRFQLADAVARGDVLATLTASETGIYGRFGFGVGTRAEQLCTRPGARPRPGAPSGGSVRLLTPERAAVDLPALYARFAPVRPGAMTRTPQWWARARSGPGTVDLLTLSSAVHTGPDGDDGFVAWTVERDGPGIRTRVRVLDLHAADRGAVDDLWRFLLGLDLVDEVQARGRPLDEDLGLILTDPRDVRVENRFDDLWVRLLDVGAALAARTWGDGPPVVLRVHDPLVEANDATFRIGPDGPKPVEDTVAPDLECRVDALAMAYLGDRRPSELVATGWWTAHDGGTGTAAARADALFATAVVPWCGTPF